MSVPMIDIETIGAGGGSVAWTDAGGMLHVGPMSAGAVPGPAAYGLGGDQPTVTDANVVLGFLRPGRALGPITLDGVKALRAVDKLATSLGMETRAAAEAIRRVVNANMEGAIRLVTAEQGLEPGSFSLMAFGGAGPLHAVDLARSLGVKRVIIPAFAGLLSAVGAVTSRIRKDYSQTFLGRLSQLAVSEFTGAFGLLRQRALMELKEYGFAPQAVNLQFQVDARYVGQKYEITIDLPEEPRDLITVRDLFHKAHLDLYGRNSLQAEVELVNYRVTAVAGIGDVSGLNYMFMTAGGQESEGQVYEGGLYSDVIYAPEEAITAARPGPLVIEGATYTAWVPKGWVADRDGRGNITLAEGM